MTPLITEQQRLILSVYEGRGKKKKKKAGGEKKKKKRLVTSLRKLVASLIKEGAEEEM